jgi:rod shape-determining protein MreD
LTPTPGALLRVGLLVLLAVVLQISGLSQLTVVGGAPDVVPLAVAAVALYAGSVPGSVTGFCMGVLLDLSLGHNLGASSLVLTAVGYGVGRFAEVRDPSHGLMPLPVAAAATAGYLAAIAGVSFMLDVGARVSPLVAREAAIIVVLNIAIALPAFALVRRIVRPVLARDLVERRRRTAPREAGPLGLRGLQIGR